MDLFAEIEARVRERQGTLERGEWRFLCPAHADRHPSARWHPTKHVWHCDACKEGGGYMQLAQLLDIDVKKAKPQITATYDYVDEQGELLYQVVRLEPGKNGKPKDFRQRRKVGAEWIWKLGKTRRVLYHLPEVLTARDAQRWVFVVEGEKDADNLCELGLVATCNAGGAGKWHPDFDEALRGTKVALLPDNDEVGRKHADQVCQGLYGVAGQLRVIYMPEGHKDVSDWLRAGGTVDDLKELVQQAAPYAPVIEETEESIERQSDLGNAQRLIQTHREILRYCHTWRRWLVWAGTHWRVDETQEVERLAKGVILTLEREAETEAQKKHAKRSQSRRAIHDMVTLAKSEGDISVTAADLDRGEYTLNVLNGLLDLTSGQLKPHDPAHKQTKLAPVAFDEKATCPRWLEFLDQIMGGNQDLVDFLQRSVGYTLAQDVSEQVLFFLFGSGRNGKSTFVNTLIDVLGDYAGKTAPDLLMTRKSEAHPTNLADLFGLRLAVTNEVQGGRSINESLVKDLTGGDPITTRRLYENNWTFKPTHKIWMYGNHKPIIRGTDEGIWRRIRLIPFNVTIPETQVDYQLPQLLREELSGILTWAVAGFIAWRSSGLGAPDEVQAATEGYRGEMDVLGTFIAECCYQGSLMSAIGSNIYDAYTSWCDGAGERPLSKRKFNLTLEERGFEKTNGTGNQVIFRGVSLRADNTNIKDFGINE